MIKVKVKKTNESISEVKISGHANHADFGNDIVCASVSSIVTTTINAIIKLDENAIDYIDIDGLVEIKVKNNNEVTTTLLINMLDLLKELELNYKNNIKIY